MPTKTKPKGRPKGEGYVYQDERGYWYARLTVAESTGKRRNIKRVARSKTEAQDILRRLVREHEDHGPRSFDGAQMTFVDLADFYEQTYIVEPQYVDDRKVSGLRSWGKLAYQMRALREFFRSNRLRAITYGDIERYKKERLKTPTIRNTQRSLASIHRELALLRTMLNVATREGWILKNPFNLGAPLINSADEKKRERIITKDEEANLLAACTGRSAHLRPIVICALDTGLRKSEILKLVWSDIDFENGIINIRAFNAKTMKERQVAITKRLDRELRILFRSAPPDPNGLVFGITDTVKTSFTTARNFSGLSDVRMHDLRHTSASRLVAAHIPLSEVGRILGHTQANTTYRYVNANIETARRAASALDSFNSEGVTPKKNPRLKKS